jgi:tight adherence protein B
MRPLPWGAAALVALFPLIGLSAAQADDTELTISHVQPSDDSQLQILLSVPAGADIDLDGVQVTVDGKPATSEATLAGTDSKDQVRRTTILAIDTSDSMKGERFAAAKAAADLFLEKAPEDVFVGVVTFDGAVKTQLSPTTDRDAATAVIDGLTLAHGTMLNDGVIEAVDLAGTTGQRSVLVLSDGKNTNNTPLAAVEKAISDAEINVDAVALDQVADDLGPLEAMTTAGKGELIPADPEALTEAFTAEAESLARQILVLAEVPADVTQTEGTVAVTATDGTETLRTESYSVIREHVAPPPQAPRAADDGSVQIPKAAMYGGLAAIGVGLLLLIGGMMVMATSAGLPKSVEQRIEAFSTAGGAGSPAANAGARKAESSGFTLDQAKDAAASMLSHNRGLEARIEQRLEAAGSAFKPAEWLLMHSTIAILFGLAGMLLGNGSFLLLFGFLVIGAFVPWLWLGYKRKKRVKAFNEGLADTLQLISGSLSAGMSLAQSLDSVVNEGNEPIAGEFRRVLVETRLGVPLEIALEGIAQRVGSTDFAWVVMAIRIQREVGGNLAELLTTVGATLRERDYLRRQVQSLSAEGRLSAYILIALPIGMLGYMLAFRREYVEPLYTEPAGFVLLFADIVLLVIGWFAMSRIVKVEV